MSMVNADALGWVTKYAADITSHGKPHRFELFHSIEGEGGSRLQVMVLEDYDEDTDPSDLAQELWDTAEKDAASRTVGMVQRYVIAVFRQPEDNENEAQMAFNLTGRSNTANVLGGNTEGASDKGLLAQLMRHTEHIQMQMNQQSELSIGRATRELKRAEERIKLLEARDEASRQLRENLMDRSQERELEAAKEEAKARRHEEIMTMMMSLAQLAAAKYLGGAGGAIAGSMPAQAARDGSIAALLGGLKEKEVAGIMSSLEPKNQQALMQLYMSYREDFQKADAAKPEMFRDGSTQEDE